MKLQSNGGFTLLELTIVVTVVVVVAAMGVPSLRQSLAAYRLSASANLVAAELNAARTLAVSRAGECQVTLIDNNTIQITDPNTTPPNNLDKAPRTAKDLDSQITFTDNTVTTLANPSSAIHFYGRGLTRAGEIVLQNEFLETTKITVTAGGRVRIE
ncbi:prepilin-type N-terminal cleavage/methylation domain-containing protein [Acidobacteria bacterium AH-259-O06]|nr:prepilin-type N-terminal cleavage/methylation domain-containing protein [Acidobacteria bacterium AH-259-O06]